MATIGRFSGRAPWLSMAAFGITGCLTALPHGSAAAEKNASASRQQVEANYYTNSEGQAASSSKDVSSARRNGASASPVVARSSTRRNSTSRSSSGRESSGTDCDNSSDQDEPSQQYVDSSSVNYYTTDERHVSPARYEAGAVTEVHASHSHRHSIFRSHAHTHTQTHDGSEQSQNSSDVRTIDTSTAESRQHVQHAPAETGRGFVGRALHRSSSAVTAVRNASASAMKSISATATRRTELVIRPTRFTGVTQSGIASWYGGKFHGGKTASGERYDQDSMTAAHRTLPFGTLVKVTNVSNGRECIVRINNRGPFTKGRILDMSRAAAAELGFMKRGLARVQLQVLGMAEK